MRACFNSPSTLLCPWPADVGAAHIQRGTYLSELPAGSVGTFAWMAPEMMLGQKCGYPCCAARCAVLEVAACAGVGLCRRVRLGLSTWAATMPHVWSLPHIVGCTAHMPTAPTNFPVLGRHQGRRFVLLWRGPVGEEADLLISI